MNRSLALARLVRLPNVFTALSDIFVGLLVGYGQFPWHVWIALPLASACFYCAGMVWNDYFDRHIDKIERPTRPIPSGAVSPKLAKWLGIALAAKGLFLAACAGSPWNGWSPWPLLVALVLLANIFAYDGGLKKTAIGPWAMGSCRFLNLLLGFSVVSLETLPWAYRLAAALALGLYVVGVTVIARDEAGTGDRVRLLTGAGISIGGCALMVFVGMKTLPGASLTVYLAALYIVAFLTGFSNLQPKPTPEATQHFVKTAILGIIVFDAILAVGLAGPMGLVIVPLLISAVIIGQWVYST